MGKRGGSGINSVARKKDQRKTYDGTSSLAGRIHSALRGIPSSGSSSSVVPEAAGPESGQAIPATTATRTAPLASVDSRAGSASDRFVTARASAPAVVEGGKASLQDALGSAANPATRQEARQQFELGKAANSSRSTNASLWRTWQRFHSEWFGATSAPLPLTPEKVSCIATMFKSGRYISFPNYAARAKAEHVSAYESHQTAWSEELTIAIRDATRSVQRGLGSSRQSMPIDIHRIHGLKLSHDPVVDGGPVSPVQFATLGAFFLTREVEITCAAFVDVVLDRERSEITWRLPVSKSDQRALGTSRTWGCVCANDNALVCPFHAAVSHFAHLEKLADSLSVSMASLPLFPGSDGGEINRAGAIATISELVKRTGASTHDASGKPLFGGHSLRTGGATTLAGLGLDSARIECMARWRSPLLLRYAKLAPLKTLTQEYRERAQRLDAQSGESQLETKVFQLQQTITRLIADLAKRERVCFDDSRPSAKDRAIHVQNRESSIWHVSSVHVLKDSSGRSKCGWQYSVRNSCVQQSAPTPAGNFSYCERCLPLLAASFNVGVESSSESSSSS